MMNNTKLRIITKQFASENRCLSWWYTLSTFSLCIILFCGIIIFKSILLKIICSVLLGFMNVRMFVIYHDHQHHAILYKSAIANILFTVYGLYMLSPSQTWRRSHNHHHNHNSKLYKPNIGSFYIMKKHDFERLDGYKRKLYLLSRHPLTIMFGYITMFIWGFCIEPFKNNPRRHVDSLIALLLHVLVGAIIFINKGFIIYFLAWFIPFFISHGWGAYLFYAQHNFPTVKFRDSIEWSYDNAALESSSFMQMNPLLRWFSANISYHHIHHLNASIPFYRLPDAMNNIPELQNPKKTSMNIKDIKACLKLKLWDIEKQEIIPLPIKESEKKNDRNHTFFNNRRPGHNKLYMKFFRIIVCFGTITFKMLRIQNR